MTDKEKDQNMRDYLHWLLSQFPKEEIKYDTNWKRFDKEEIKYDTNWKRFDKDKIK